VTTDAPAAAILSSEAPSPICLGGYSGEQWKRRKYVTLRDVHDGMDGSDMLISCNDIKREREMEGGKSWHILNLTIECRAENWIGRRFDVSVYSPALRAYSTVAYSLALSIRRLFGRLDHANRLLVENWNQRSQLSSDSEFESRAALMGQAWSLVVPRRFP
jgi:hypothetical protein